MGQPLHRLNILRKNLDTRVEQCLDRRPITKEVRRQGLDRSLRIQCFGGTHHIGVMTRAAIGQIITIHRGQHHIFQAHQLDGLCRILRFLRIQPAPGVTRIDRAEPAGACADIAHQHDRGGTCTPALANVGTLGFLTNRGQPMLVNDAPHRVKLRTALHAHAQPFRFSQSLRICR